ncbi:acyltransferase family protein [Geodermatophilus sp. SYSU D00758]
MSVLVDQGPPATAGPRTPRRRPEIDGLRALAVSLVVLYHVATGRVSGGVDVFLVLSGFFLVHGMAGQVRRTGRVRVLSTVTRTLSRLVPAAALVLAATALLGLAVVPRSRWPELAAHLVASMTFTENHRLVHEAVDYSASNAAASPVQQFWSLSVQVQVLLAAPLVVAAGMAVLHRAGLRAGRRTAVAAVAVATAASFAWSVVATAADQQVAYFSTLPRVWEIGVGALVALTLAGLRPGTRTALLSGWGGVVALVACGAVLDGAHTFPGWQAAWPVLCAVAVLVAGSSGGRFGVHRFLGSAPLQWLGVRSYALYLWHWPLLVLYLVWTGRESPSVHGGVGVVALSLVLCAVTSRLVERPAAERLQARSPVRAMAVVLACALPVAGAGAAGTAWVDRELDRMARVADDPAYPGALALRTATPATGGVPGVTPLPSPIVIRDDWPALPEGACTTEDAPGEPVPVVTEVCVERPADPQRRVVVVGDSHAAQWLPPVSALGARHSWEVVSIVRGGCNLSTESEFIQEGWPDYEECAAWRARLVDRIVALDPDLVVALGTRTAVGPDEEVLPPGFVAAWQQLAERGIRVVGVRDNPRHEQDVPDCLARWGDDAEVCTLSRGVAYTDAVLQQAAEVLPDGVDLLDTSSYFCTRDTCPAVVGNVRVYMDFNHVSGTYMRTVTPLLERDLLALTGW